MAPPFFFRGQAGPRDDPRYRIEIPDIFNHAFLTKLKTFHEDLENNVPYLSEARSLINARVTWGEEDTLYVDDLLKDWPETQVDLTDLKDQVLSNPAYINDIITEDGKTAAVIIETETFVERQYFSQKENQHVIGAVAELMDRYERFDFSMAVSGGPFVFDNLNRNVSAIYDIDRNFGNVVMLEVIVDTKKENGILDPLILQRIEKLSRDIEENEIMNKYKAQNK